MKEHVTKLYSLCAGDGALPAAACVGAVCVCCRTTTATAWYEVPGAELAGMPQVRPEPEILTQSASVFSFQCRICQQCWLAYRKYSAVTPGGMSKDAPANVVGNTSKFPGLKSTAKKATTLFLTPTLMARVSRKLPGANVSNFLESCLRIVFFEFSAGQKNQKASKETVQTSRF